MPCILLYSLALYSSCNGWWGHDCICIRIIEEVAGKVIERLCVFVFVLAIVFVFWRHVQTERHRIERIVGALGKVTGDRDLRPAPHFNYLSHRHSLP